MVTMTAARPAAPISARAKELHEDRQTADAIADSVIDAFAKKHPQIALPYMAWQDLREMIEREVLGWLSDTDIGAAEV